MLHRVEMNIIQMHLQIPIIPNLVFPEPPLPNGAFPVADFGTGQQRRPDRFLGNRLGEFRFDQPPAFGIICLIRRQGSETMQMVGQDNQGIQGERIVFLNLDDEAV